MRKKKIAITLEDECVGECTQLEQSMLVGGVTRKARYLQAEYDADEEGPEQFVLLADSPVKSGTCGGV